MSVWTALEPASSTVDPGGAPRTLTLRVRNTGDTVEEYGISVIGPLTAWAQVAPDRLRIYPGDEATATITVAVPRTPDATAGEAPFGVRVVPRVHPELSDVAESTVTVAAFSRLQADLNPVTVRGRLSAQLQITVDNQGNAPLPIRLEGRDDEDALRFAERPAVLVPAGATECPTLRVRPRRRRLTGRPERYSLVVTVAPGEAAVGAGAQPAQLRGTYVRLALLSGRLLWSVLMLLLVGAAAVGLMFLPSTDLQRLLLPALPLPAAGGPNPLPPSVAQQAAPPQAAPQLPRELQNQAGTVTISHDGLALTAVDNPNGHGPAQGVLPTGAAPLRNRSWTVLELQDGSVVISPAAVAGLVLGQPDPDDPARIELSEASDGRLRPGQTWLLRQTGNGVAIVNRATGTCLTDVGNGLSTTGAQCRLQPARSQVWVLGGS